MTPLFATIAVSIPSLLLLGLLVWVWRLYRRVSALNAAATTHRDIEAALTKKTLSLAADLARAQDVNRLYVSEAEHVVTARLPAEVLMHAQDTVVDIPGLKHPELAGSQFAQAHQAIIDKFRQAVMTIRDEAGGNALAVLREALEGVQIEQVRLVARIRAEIEKHNEPAAVESLMACSAHASVALRILQRLRVLAGSFSGVLYGASTIPDIVQGASGRIEQYTDVHQPYNKQMAGVYVTERAVNPLAMALAELLDNATKHSTRPVDVTLAEVATGYVITIDDRGVAMSDMERERANKVLAGRVPLDITRTRDALQLGLRVVALLARDYGFSAQFAGPSPFGGNRVVMLVPHALTVPVPDDLGALEISAEDIAGPVPRFVDPLASAPIRLERDAIPVQRTATTRGGLPIRERNGTSQPPPARPRQADPRDFNADAMDITGLAGALRDHDKGENS